MKFVLQTNVLHDLDSQPSPKIRFQLKVDPLGWIVQRMVRHGLKFNGEKMERL